MDTMLAEVSEPELLTDDSRLQEIYDLRVDIWGEYEKSAIVNRRLFPHGWYDELDETAFHWVMINENNKIIAAARLNIFDSASSFIYQNSVKHIPMPATFPFAFFSRLIVHPDYRGEARSAQFAGSRLTFCKERGIKWAQVFITNTRILELFRGLGFGVAGSAEVNYHKDTKPHRVNVLVREFETGGIIRL